MLLKFIDVYISLENAKHTLIFALQTVDHVKHRIFLGLYWLLWFQIDRDFCAQFLKLCWRRAFQLFLQCLQLAFLVALASSHIVFVVFFVLFATKQRGLGGAERIFARLGKLSLSILGL